MIAGIFAGMMSSAVAPAPPPPPPPPPPSSSLAVSIDARAVENVGDGTAIIKSTYTLSSDGKVRDHNSVILENWLDGGAASEVEARVLVQSGTLSTGTTGSWLALSTSRSWTRSASVGQNTACQIKVELRNASTQVILDTALIDLNVYNVGSGGGTA